MRAFLLPLLLTACTAPNHLGSPLTLPVSGAITVLENAQYDARRGKVSAHLARHAAAFRRPLPVDAPEASALWQIARIPAQNRAKVLREIREAPAKGWVEAATVIVMVHGA